MAISRRSTSTTTNTSATTSHTIAKPSGATVDDVLVMQIALNGSSISSGGIPSGWTAIVQLDGQSNPKLHAYYHVVDSGDSSITDWTWTSDSSAASSLGMACYIGVDTSTPIDAGPTSYEANGPNLACSSITVTTDAWLIGGVALNSSNVNNWITEPTGWNTILWDLGGKRSAYSDKGPESSGATGTQTWTTKQFHMQPMPGLLLLK